MMSFRRDSFFYKRVGYLGVLGYFCKMKINVVQGIFYYREISIVVYRYLIVIYFILGKVMRLVEVYYRVRGFRMEIIEGR